MSYPLEACSIMSRPGTSKRQIISKVLGLLSGLSPPIQSLKVSKSDCFGTICSKSTLDIARFRGKVRRAEKHTSTS